MGCEPMKTLTSEIIAADVAEAKAFERMYACAPGPLRVALGLEVRHVAGATLLLAPAVPNFMFNRVIGLGNEGPVEDRQIDAITKIYAGLGVHGWWAHVTPDGAANGVVAQLEARGFTRPERRTWRKCGRGRMSLAFPDTSLHIRPWKPADAEAVGVAITNAFSMPPAFGPWFAEMAAAPDWRCLVATREGKVVGGGMLHLQGGSAWLGAGGMLPEARGLKGHRALMAARILAAIEGGCQRIYTETGEPIGDEANPSLRNMEVCGFETLCSRENFVAPN